nr:unnamed protein product [Digitaria exilis]
MVLIRISFLLLLFSTTEANHATTETSLTSCEGDERALVAFKTMISHHSGVLTSWNQSISYCSWDGVTCGKKHPWRVVALKLGSQGLTGTISPAIGNLTFLHSLNLSSSGLHGEIPPSIGSLRRLESLDLSQNMLSGVIPSNISYCTSLRVMHISSNKGVQGSIPAEIGGMSSLASLVLYNNSMTGTIPSSLGNLSQLVILSLRMNYLEGSMPADIGRIPYLRFLQLSCNDLSDYMVIYQAPADLGKSFSSITYIGFGAYRFTGPLPLSLTNLRRLKVLDVFEDSFTGVVPS